MWAKKIDKENQKKVKSGGGNITGHSQDEKKGKTFFDKIKTIFDDDL